MSLATSGFMQPASRSSRRNNFGERKVLKYLTCFQVKFEVSEFLDSSLRYDRNKWDPWKNLFGSFLEYSPQEVILKVAEQRERDGVQASTSATCCPGKNGASSILILSIFQPVKRFKKKILCCIFGRRKKR